MILLVLWWRVGKEVLVDVRGDLVDVVEGDVLHGEVRRGDVHGVGLVVVGDEEVALDNEVVELVDVVG